MKIGKIISIFILLTSFFTTPIDIVDLKMTNEIDIIDVAHIKYNLDYTKLNKTLDTLFFSMTLLLVLPRLLIISSYRITFKAYLLLFVPILKHSIFLKPIKFQSDYLV